MLTQQANANPGFRLLFSGHLLPRSNGGHRLTGVGNDPLILSLFPYCSLCLVPDIFSTLDSLIVLLPFALSAILSSHLASNSGAFCFKLNCSFFSNMRIFFHFRRQLHSSLKCAKMSMLAIGEELTCSDRQVVRHHQ